MAAGDAAMNGLSKGFGWSRGVDIESRLPDTIEGATSWLYVEGRDHRQSIPGHGRTKRRPLSDVYAWSIRDALPTIPIPLLSPDSDISLDLAKIVAAVDDRGHYERSIDYHAPLALPLGVADRTWAEELARSVPL